MPYIRAIAVLVFVAWTLPAWVAEAEKDLDNDGTGPTRPPTLAAISFEHLDLRDGIINDTVVMTLQSPIGSGRQILKLRVPI